MYSLAAFAAFAFFRGFHAAARQAYARLGLILQMGSGSVTGVFLR
jgi:hypothetical protein